MLFNKKATLKAIQDSLDGTYNFNNGDYHQALLDICYDHWKTEKGWRYEDMLKFAKLTYGELIEFIVLIGKYNQQVTNGGHYQYLDWPRLKFDRENLSWIHYECESCKNTRYKYHGQI